MNPRLAICMGVSGCGKTTLGSALASHCDMTFIDADDFHDARNTSLMAAGTPLTEAERAPWMAAISADLAGRRDAGEHCVLAHSALRRNHRDQLRELGFVTVFFHLDLDRDILLQRLSNRKAHFAGADLLESQLETLELPTTEADVVTMDSALPIDLLVADAVRFLESRMGDEFRP